MSAMEVSVVVGGVGIDEAARREQEDVVGGRADTADAQVVAVGGVHRDQFAPGLSAVPMKPLVRMSMNSPPALMLLVPSTLTTCV